jgi:hypothetical protein
MQSAQNPKGPTIPAGKVFRLKELPGWLGKDLVVPPGRQGVTVRQDGPSRTYPPGKHRILSAWGRLLGQGAGLLAGYIPAEPFRAVILVPYLFSGDQVLLDTSVSALVSVCDAGRYLVEQVAPAGEMAHAVVDLSGPDVKMGIASLVRRYSAADLVQGLPTRLIANEIQSRLQEALQGQGLLVYELQVISFWRSDERVLAAEKIQAMEERLHGLEMQQSMASAETQAQYDDFIHQLQPGLGEIIGVRPVAPSATAGRPVSETLKSWVRPGQSAQAPRPHWALQDLFGRKDSAETTAAGATLAAPKVRRPPRRWWMPGMLYILGLGVIAALLTWLVQQVGRQASPNVTIPFITSLWMAVIPLALNEFKKMHEKREEYALATWALPGATRLDILVKNDRAHADRLVREQCRAELHTCSEMLADMVTRIYKSGQTELAIQVRDLKEKFLRGEGQVAGGSFGAPAYLEDVHLSDQAWERMLDYDEDLLQRAGTLSHTVNVAQLGLSDASKALNLPGLEQNLDAFLYRFSGRTRALKAVNS